MVGTPALHILPSALSCPILLLLSPFPTRQELCSSTPSLCLNTGPKAMKTLTTDPKFQTMSQNLPSCMPVLPGNHSQRKLTQPLSSYGPLICHSLRHTSQMSLVSLQAELPLAPVSPIFPGTATTKRSPPQVSTCPSLAPWP